MKNKITKIAKIIRTIGIIILMSSFIWGAFLIHYIFGMLVLGFSILLIGTLITHWEEL